MPEPNEEKHFVIDHIESQDAHSVTAVTPPSHAETGVVACHLCWKQLTHWVQKSPHDSFFRRDVEISNIGDGRRGGSKKKRKQNQEKRGLRKDQRMVTGVGRKGQYVAVKQSMKKAGGGTFRMRGDFLFGGERRRAV